MLGESVATADGVAPRRRSLQRWDYTLPLALDANRSRERASISERGEGFSKPVCGGVGTPTVDGVADEALRSARRIAADVGHAPGSPQLLHRRARYPMRPTRRRRLRSGSARSAGPAETRRRR